MGESVFSYHVLCSAGNVSPRHGTVALEADLSRERFQNMLELLVRVSSPFESINVYRGEEQVAGVYSINSVEYGLVLSERSGTNPKIARPHIAGTLLAREAVFVVSSSYYLGLDEQVVKSSITENACEPHETTLTQRS